MTSCARLIASGNEQRLPAAARGKHLFLKDENIHSFVHNTKSVFLSYKAALSGHFLPNIIGFPTAKSSAPILLRTHWKSPASAFIILKPNNSSLPSPSFVAASEIHRWSRLWRLPSTQHSMLTAARYVGFSVRSGCFRRHGNRSRRRSDICFPKGVSGALTTFTPGRFPDAGARGPRLQAVGLRSALDMASVGFAVGF